jgi:hypothetical protein
MSNSDRTNKRYIRNQHFENALFEAVCNLVEEYKPTYSELFLVLNSMAHRWARLMIEDENDGILKVAASFYTCTKCGGKLIRRRTSYVCEDCKQPADPFSAAVNLGQEGP